jgi:hypothetical protein
MNRGNGSFIGINKEDISYDFSGVYPLYEQQENQLAGTWPSKPPDPGFVYNSLLLKTSSTLTAGVTTVADSSPSPLTITRNGAPSTGWPSPYGYWSNYLDGSSFINFALNSYLTTGPCTVEAWVNCPSFSTSPSIVENANWNIGQNCGWRFSIGTNGRISFNASAGVFNTYPNVITTTSSITINTWNHIAFVRDASNVCRIYINGVDGGGSVTYSASFNLNSGVGYRGTEIGRSVADGGTYQQFTGYISNLRIVNNTAVYTAPFTPSTVPLTAISGTSLLTCQSNRFVDNSVNNATFTLTGTPQVTSYYYPSGFTAPSDSIGACYFNGTSTYLSLPGSTTSLYLPGAFTWEAWVYPIATNGLIYGTWNDAASNPDGWAFWYNNSGSFPATGNTARIYWYDGNYGANECAKYSTTALPLNQWNHLVFQRDGSNVIKFFLNGVSLTLANVSVNGKNFDDTFAFNNVAPIGIGGSANGVYRYTGYISNMRFVQSTAVYAGNFTPPSGLLTTTGGTYPSTTNVNTSIAATNTKLLVNFADSNYTSVTNAATNNTFIDSSNYALTITRNGTATQGSFTPYWPNGYWSNYFNGAAGTRLTIPANTVFAFGTGDFTVEAWIYPTASPSGIGQIIGGHNSGSNADWTFHLSSTNIMGFYGTNGTYQFAASSAVSLNQWTHVAIVVASTVPRFYYNGVLNNTGTASQLNNIGNATAITIGDDNTGNANSSFTGYISNLRVVKGLAVYTGAFTAPTTPLTATQSADTNIAAITGTATSLLTCRSSRFIDNSVVNSGSGWTITTNGVPQVRSFRPLTLPSAYTPAVYGGSGYFNGTTDYLTLPTAPLPLSTTSNFTLEAWVYTNSASDQTIFYILGNTTTYAGIRVGVISSTAYILHSQAGNNWAVQSGNQGSVPTNTWNHIAVTRNVNAGTLWVNGISVYTFTFGTLYSSTVNYIGAIYLNTAPSVFFNGYISNARIVNGTAIYTAAFTPSTAPLTAIASTSLLLNFANAAIYDVAAQNNLVTASTAQASTTVYKWTPTSLRFNGTTDYLSLPTNPVVTLGAGNWTVEFWMFPTSVAIAQNIIIDWRTSNNSQPVLYLINAVVTWRVNSATLLSSGTIIANTWTHLALVKNGSTTTLYLNGINTTTAADTVTYASDSIVQIGKAWDANYFNGYIQDLRITRGIARYTANFTSPATTLVTVGITVPSSVEYLVVAGGGGGANGGGGAGGYLTSTGYSVVNSTPYTVTVGAGGGGTYGGNASTVLPTVGTNGSNSVFATITAAGGGLGGYYTTVSGITGGTAGGSGGGAPPAGGGQSRTGGAGNTPATTPSQGNAGGNNFAQDGNGAAGGGGGAGAVGAAGSFRTGGAGGIGLQNGITGTTVFYAGGGGGFGVDNRGLGGTGGGGDATATAIGISGTANTGGGGGAVDLAQTAGAGGSGIVIIAYPTSFPPLTAISAGLTYDQPSRPGYRVYRFTAGTGTITW